MEKKTHHSEPEHIGSIIEQWFKRFELIAKGSDYYYITKGKLYAVASIDMDDKQLAIMGDRGYWEWFSFENVPNYFEIRIREA